MNYSRPTTSMSTFTSLLRKQLKNFTLLYPANLKKDGSKSRISRYMESISVDDINSEINELIH